MWAVLAFGAGFASHAIVDRIAGQAELRSLVANSDTCLEDDPCWQCETMGNGVCGPVTLHVDEKGWWVTDRTDTPIAGGTHDQVDD